MLGGVVMMVRVEVVSVRSSVGVQLGQGEQARQCIGCAARFNPLPLLTRARSSADDAVLASVSRSSMRLLKKACRSTAKSNGKRRVRG